MPALVLVGPPQNKTARDSGAACPRHERHAQSRPLVPEPQGRHHPDTRSFRGHREAQVACQAPWPAGQGPAGRRGRGRGARSRGRAGRSGSCAGHDQLRRSPSEGRLGATSSDSLHCCPHMQPLASRWGRARRGVQPLSSCVDGGDTVFLSPKPAVSVAPSLPGRPALCEAHTCRLQRGFRGTGRGPATVPSSDAVTRPCRDHAPPPPACSVPRQPFAQRLACARAPWPEAGSVCLGLTFEGLSQGPLGSPAACPVIWRCVGSSSGRDICSWASVAATALPPWEGGTICRDGAIGPSALSGGRLTQLVWL